MMMRLTLTTERARQKVIDFVGEKNVMRMIPLEGMEKFSVDCVLNNIAITSENNTIFLIDTVNKVKMELFVTEYLVIKIF